MNLKDSKDLLVHFRSGSCYVSLNVLIFLPLEPLLGQFQNSRINKVGGERGQAAPNLLWVLGFGENLNLWAVGSRKKKIKKKQESMNKRNILHVLFC